MQASANQHLKTSNRTERERENVIATSTPTHTHTSPDTATPSHTNIHINRHADVIVNNVRPVYAVAPDLIAQISNSYLAFTYLVVKLIGWF